MAFKRLLFLLTTLATTGAAALTACSGDNLPARSTEVDAGRDDASFAIEEVEQVDAAASGPVAIQILAFNDFHGNLEAPTGSSGLVAVPLTDPLVTKLGTDAGVRLDPDAGIAAVPAGGAAYLSTRIKQFRAIEPNTVVVSAGDMTGASPFLSSLFRDEPTVRVLDAMGLDLNGVGNHEFDRGLAELLRLQKGGCNPTDCDGGSPSFGGAKYTYLAANVVNTEAKATIFPPYAIRAFGAAKVAFIGMTLEGTPTVTVEKAVQGLSFKNEVATVNALVPELKSQGAAAIVVLVHQGAFQGPEGTHDTCKALSGELLPILEGLDRAIDVVVSAHTHQPYNCSIDKRLVTSAASFGRVVTKIDLVVDPNERKVISKKAVNIVNSREVIADPEVLSLIATYQTKSATLANRVVGYVAGDVLGRTGYPSCESPIGDLIADAQLAATRTPEEGGASIAFMNPGGIRTDIVYAPSSTEPPGAVTYAEAFAVQPFANNLITMTLTGAQIETLLQQQFSTRTPRILQVSDGFSYTYAYDPATNTVVLNDIKLLGLSINPRANYRVTVNSFLAGGGDGFVILKSGTNRLSGAVDLDVLVSYLGANERLAPPTASRITGNGCQL